MSAILVPKELNGKSVTAAEVQPEAHLMQLVTGSLVSQAVYVAAKLGVADLLAGGAKTVGELAGSTGAHEGSLYRVLRTLSSVGVFAECEERTFELTPSAWLLQSNVAGTLRDTAIFMGEEYHWRVWGHTLHSVMTGQPAWAEVHGADVFPYFQSNPEQAEIFDRAMTSMSHSAANAVVDAYDFSGIRKLVDVAGGHGRMLMRILQENRCITGVLFDQKHVIEGARPSIEVEGFAHRIEFVAGDFFESLPAGADAYIMKHIIHDWDDAQALTILKNIERVMDRNGRVLVVEMVVPAGNEPHFSKILDLEMLVSPGGRERTEAEYAALFASAGLRLRRIVQTNSPFSILEAVK